MYRLLVLIAIALLATTHPASAQPGALLTLYQDRDDASTRLFVPLDNVPIGATLPDCCTTVQGTLSFDPQLRHILLVQQLDDGGQQLVRINAGSGAIAGRAAIAAGWQVLAAAYDRTRSTLFAIARNAAGDRHLASIALATGAISPIGPALAADIALVAGGHGLHPRRGQWHLLFDPAAAGQRVLTLNLSNGQVVANAAIGGAYHLSNLHFDEGSGRLLGLGRSGDGNAQTRFLWLNPGTGQVVPLQSSGIPGCCPWATGSLYAIAATGAVGTHAYLPGGPHFVFWDAGTGISFGLLPHPPAWAIHGMVADQTDFIGDYVFHDGFEQVAKPTGSLVEE